MRKFNKDDLLEMDFNAYLASSSDEDEEQGENNNDLDLSDDEDKKIEKYKVSYRFATYSKIFLRGTASYIYCEFRRLVRHTNN